MAIKRRPFLTSAKAGQLRWSVYDALSSLVTDDRKRLNLVDSAMLDVFDVPMIPRRGDAVERWLINCCKAQTDTAVRDIVRQILEDYRRHADEGISLTEPL